MTQQTRRAGAVHAGESVLTAYASCTTTSTSCAFPHLRVVLANTPAGREEALLQDVAGTCQALLATKLSWGKDQSVIHNMHKDRHHCITGGLLTVFVASIAGHVYMEYMLAGHAVHRIICYIERKVR